MLNFLLVEHSRAKDAIIVIGKGVWIASRAMILGPCRIGDHAVIAAGSVVTGDIPSGVLYGGVPARFIRNLQFNQTLPSIETRAG